MTTITASELQKDVSGVLDQLQSGTSILITRDGHTVARLEPVDMEPSEASLPEPPPWEEIMAEVWRAQAEIAEHEKRTVNPVLEERKRRRR